MSLIEWTVSLHVTGVILWIGGLFSLTWLHVQPASRRGMEGGPLRGAQSVFESLVHPALMLVLATGIFLVFLEPALLAQPWFRLKVALVGALIAMDVRAFRVIIAAGGARDGRSSRHIPLRAGMAAGLLGVLILTVARSC